ncbi:MAG: HD-GYP domain-containing protein [Candidatus Aminicenantales bacterium]
MKEKLFPLSPEKQKALHQAGVEVVVRFYSLLKLARLYSSQNVLFQEQLNRVYQTLQNLLTEAKEVSLKVREGTFFLKNVRLRFTFSNYYAFKFALQELERRQVGAIYFLPGFTLEEWQNLVMAFTIPEAKTQPFESLADQLTKSRIKNIQLEKATEVFFPEKKEKDRATKQVYFSALLHLKDLFEAEDPQQALKLNTTRRLMQALFTHVTENEAFVFGLTNIKNYDEYTLNHSVNVCLLSIALGKRLGLDRNELIDLGVSAFFHDFGKLATPKEILNKPSKLEPSERQIIEKHPHHGAGSLALWRETKGIPLRAINVAMEHHIKEDLSGYPQTFKKKSTHLFSKIVKIADYFDAITTKRVYRKHAFSREEALSLMLEQGSREFHPLLLRLFVQMMGAYPVGSVVLLNTAEVGLVVENNPDPNFLLRPKVKLIVDSQGRRLDGPVVDLTTKDLATQKYLRTIVKGLDPEKYNLKVADYFIAATQG